MSTSANSEQLKAIEHTGGVLLKAGAGSGKTFVLKEHMIYRTQRWFDEYQSLNLLESFSDYIASKFSKTILMTFTKKAAGELQIRLRKEFLENAQNKGSFWKEALDSLDKLTVTTIHGFCYKLIKEGHFVNVDSSADIIDYSEFIKKITFLFDQWVQEQKSLDEFLIKDHDKVLNSLIGIFSDPMLRKAWKNIDIDNYTESDTVLKDLFKIYEIDELFGTSLDLASENEGKPWHDLIVSFANLNVKEINCETFLILYNFFNSLDFKIPRSPSGKTVTPEEKATYGLIKNLKDFLKKNGEDIEKYLKQFDQSIKPWFFNIKSSFDYIDKNYNQIRGVTFSDLEYIVYNELKDRAAQESVSKSYNYLIVDEFQDTSFIQFDIIKSVLDNDLTKLFCVGDIKQAIYGFRGGELGVFHQCSEMIPQVLSLKNNYRSDQKIINFNNKFFENIFAKGLGFEGKEQGAVEVEYQEVPIPSRPIGAVKEISVSLEGVESLSSRDLELVEALSILREIEGNTPVKDVILYKKLKPSLIMMGLLIQKNISFTAQVKVPYLEDPILAIFLNLLENHFDENKFKDESLTFTLIAYFEIIGFKVDTNKILKEVALFNTSHAYFGLYQSYINFLSNLGIFNSNYKNNISFIENVCRLYNDDFEKLISVISSKDSESYSLDFNFGNNPSSLNLMSAHASKGLEFETVYIGGIYTNGSTRSDSSIVGKFPLSFIWKDELHSKKKYLTPQLMLEREISKRKDFSESKRLFYVASTRAENCLKWVNIDLSDIKTKNPGHHWIKGINSWKEDGVDLEEIKDLFTNDFLTLNAMSLDSSLKTRPLFQIDEVGITLNSDGLEKLIMPELSVTRLAVLHDCPRKFYFKNILKMDLQSQNKIDYFEDSVPEIKSSSTRGTKIHEEISKIILNGFSKDNLELEFEKTYTWVLDKLSAYLDTYELISEKSTKFEVFGHMISGIPDLIIKPLGDEEELEIWDFKSGRSKSDSDSSYHFQLYCYAYSQYILGNYSKDKPTKLVLCYVDEERLVDQTVFFNDVENYLRSFWDKANSPWIKNTENCDSCEFNELCE